MLQVSAKQTLHFRHCRCVCSPSPGLEQGFITGFIADHPMTLQQEAVSEGEAVPGVCYYDSPRYKH